MRDFFAARNPSKQMSTAFESYLIKPVQRVLKYPLILRELKYTDTISLDVRLIGLQIEAGAGLGRFNTD